MKRKAVAITIATLGITGSIAWFLPPAAPTIHFVRMDDGPGMATFEVRNDSWSAYHYLGTDAEHPWLIFRLQTPRGMRQLMQPTGCILHSAYTISPGRSVTFSIPAPKWESSAISVGVDFMRGSADGSDPSRGLRALETWLERIRQRFIGDFRSFKPTWSEFVPVTRVNPDAPEDITGFSYP